MPAWMVAALMDARGFTRVDENQSFVVLDEPGIDGEPVGPAIVDEHVPRPREPLSLPGLLRWPDENRASLNVMNVRQHDQRA